MFMRAKVNIFGAKWPLAPMYGFGEVLKERVIFQMISKKGKFLNLVCFLQLATKIYVLIYSFTVGNINCTSIKYL